MIDRIRIKTRQRHAMPDHQRGTAGAAVLISRARAIRHIAVGSPTDNMYLVDAEHFHCVIVSDFQMKRCNFGALSCAA